MNASVLNVRKLDDKYTLKLEVRITREFKARVWLARVLILAACKVLGCGAEVTVKDAET